MKEKTKCLNTIRNELQFNVIISMRAQVDVLALKESIALEALDEQTKTMIKTILAGDNAIIETLREYTTALNRRLEDNQRRLAQQIENSDSLAIQHHQEQMTSLSSRRNKPLDSEESEDIISKVDQRLRTHCAGLLEMKQLPLETSSIPRKDDNDFHEGKSPSDLEVCFLHRSVAQFLDKPEVWSEFSQMTTDFNIDLSFLKGYLVNLKTAPSKIITWHEWEYIERIMRLSGHAEVQIPASVESLLDEVDKKMVTMTKTWDSYNNEEVVLKCHWTDYFSWDRRHHLDRNVLPHRRDVMHEGGFS